MRTFSLINLSRCTAGLETGSTSQQVAILVQAGLASRTAAQVALEQFPGDFIDYDATNAWLDNPLMLELVDQPWPTESTALVWRDFLAQLKGSSTAKWRRMAIKAFFDDDDFSVEPETRGWLRPLAESHKAEFLLPDMTVCGLVDFKFPAYGPQMG